MIVIVGSKKAENHGFISKTKAALHYYFKNVTGNSTINALYYIGDLVENTYENNQGVTKQRNDAHFIELSSAMAIVDFSNTDISTIGTNQGKPENPVYKEFGIKENVEQINFNHLTNDTLKLIRSNITQYFYFNIFLKDEVQNKLKHTDDVVHCVVPNTITFSGGSTRNKIHPTQKPTEILRYFIELCSNENDTVFDPFAGSGSTGIAAKESNRQFILIERDSKMFAKMSEQFNKLFD